MTGRSPFRQRERWRGSAARAHLEGHQEPQRRPLMRNFPQAGVCTLVVPLARNGLSRAVPNSPVSL
jgi:hypothetical protein